MKLAKFKSENNILISFILSLLILAMFKINGDVESFNLFSVIIFIFTYYITYKTDFEFRDKKHFIATNILTIIFSLIMVVGGLCYTYHKDAFVNIIGQIFTLKSCICFLRIFCIVLYNSISFTFKII